MKRALSLLLTLAMVMSLFTVSAFADETPTTDGGGTTTTTTPDGTKENPFTNWANPVQIELPEGATNAQIVADGTIELTANVTGSRANNEKFPGHNDDYGDYDFTGDDKLSYTWTITPNEGSEAGGLVKQGSDTSAKFTVKGVKAGTYTVKVRVLCKGVWTASNTVTTRPNGAPAECYYVGEKTQTVTVAANNYELRLYEGETKKTSAESMTLLPSDVKESKLVAKFYTKDTPASGDTAAVTGTEQSGATITYESSNTGVATVAFEGSKVKVTGVAKGTATIKAKAAYMGATYEKTICTVSVTALGIEQTVVNGKTFDITAKALAEAIAANIKTVTGAATAPTLTGVTLSVPTGKWIGKVYYGSSTSTSNEKKAASGATSISVEIPDTDVASTTNKLYLTTTKGTIGSLSIPYTATTSSNSYSGTLTLKSGFDTAVNDTQTAEFTSEAFTLGSVGSSIERVRAYSASLEASSSYSSADAKKVSETLVTPSSSDWTVKYIGYESDGAAHLVTVDFKAIDYDVLTYAQDGSAPFQFSTFESFMESVNKEQDDHNYVKLDSVEFKDVKETGKWELKNGKSTLSTSKELDSSDLAKITVDVSKPGIYTLDFEVNFKYKSTSSGSWSSSTSTYDGILCLYATSDGDIKYEVSYGEAVTFDASDFQKFYKSASSGSNAKLEYVTFDAEPVFGTLYREPSRTSSRYEVDSSDDFYVDPTGSRYDLDEVTYKAALSDKDEYSVYIPFTAYGNRSSETGVVEIVINGDLPFTDVAKTSTFYDYIKYVYNNGIMGGKSATKFDAKSSITRMQLVLTLYRMAGSPTTYNKRTITFTDCKKLSTEATAALKWAIATKVVSGYENNTFSPNSAVTRQAMVTILYRFADQSKYDISVSSTNNLSGFTDAAKVSSSMKTAMNWAVENGFVSGNGKLLNPVGSTTRGAAAKILATFHETYVAG